MATIGGYNVVTDGLVLSLDAANRRSYVSGSTTWFDVSGNRNSGSLVNGPTFDSANGGGIRFDGIDDYVGISDSPAIKLVGESSISMWIMPRVLKTWGNVIWKANYPSDGYGVITDATGDIQLQISPANTPQNIDAGPGTLVNNEICNIVFTINSSKLALCYKNGLLIRTEQSTYSILSSNRSLDIGADRDNTRYFDGNIYSIMYYNRVLTSSEVLQNYNALKGRFGL